VTEPFLPPTGREAERAQGAVGIACGSSLAELRALAGEGGCRNAVGSGVWLLVFREQSAVQREFSHLHCQMVENNPSFLWL